MTAKEAQKKATRNSMWLELETRLMPYCFCFSVLIALIAVYCLTQVTRFEEVLPAILGSSFFSTIFTIYILFDVGWRERAKREQLL